jgi:glycosyltransferase involved in cell wall biosynthesis
VDPYAVVVLIPVYNDWIAVSLLLEQLDRALSGNGLRARVFLVDDGSTEPAGATFDAVELKAIDDIHLLSLRRNFGHQRAIAIGLAYLESEFPCDAVVVMDGDGQDDPADIPRLIERCRALGNTRIVFAERTRRVDSLTFRALYACYRAAHWVLTGVKVRVGNFSVIPRQVLRKLVTVSELWNHYAAAVYAAKLPRDTIETSRRPRLHGQSKMNVGSLVGHGLSAMSVHGEALAVRLLFGSLIVGFLFLAGLALLAAAMTGGYRTASSPVTIVGAVFALGLSAELVGMALVLALRTLQGRAASSFLPLRDYKFYIDTVAPLRVRAGSATGGMRV